MSERLTRKEIKRDIREDEVALFINRVFDWVGENPRLLIRVAIGLVALVVLALAANLFVDGRKEAAADALAEAMKTWNTPVVEGDAADLDADAPRFASQEERRAAAKERLDAVRGRFASGAAGEVAGLFLADIAVAEDQPDQAHDLWQDFAEEHQGHMLAVIARLNLISLARQQGDGEALADELRGELEGGRPSLPEDMLLYELARTLDGLGRVEDARIYYQQIVDEHASSPYVSEARQRTSDTAT